MSHKTQKGFREPCSTRSVLYLFHSSPPLTVICPPLNLSPVDAVIDILVTSPLALQSPSLSWGASPHTLGVMGFIWSGEGIEVCSLRHVDFFLTTPSSTFPGHNGVNPQNGNECYVGWKLSKTITV